MTNADDTAAATETWPPHLWLPDLAVDHDAPVCETCGEGMDGNHYGDSLWMDYVDGLEAELLRLRDEVREAQAYKNAANAEAAMWLSLAQEKEREAQQLRAALETIRDWPERSDHYAELAVFDAHNMRVIADVALEASTVTQELMLKATDCTNCLSNFCEQNDGGPTETCAIFTQKMFDERATTQAGET